MVLEILFKWVLFSSAMGGVLALLIFVTKALLGERLNARWHYFIWFLLIARLILPVAPQSNLSISNLFTHFQNTQKIEITQYGNTSPLDKRGVKESTPQTSIELNTAQIKNIDIKPNSSTDSYQQSGNSVKSISSFNVMSFIWLVEYYVF